MNSCRCHSSTCACAAATSVQPFISFCTNPAMAASESTPAVSSKSALNCFDGRQRSTCSGWSAGNASHSARSSLDLKWPKSPCSGVPTNADSLHTVWSHQPFRCLFLLGCSMRRAHLNSHSGSEHARSCNPRLLLLACLGQLRKYSSHVRSR